MKKIMFAIAAGAMPLAPAAAQIGSPGATDWAQKLQPPAASPFSPVVPAGRADDYVSIVNLLNTYFIALDAGDLDTYTNTFAPDAVMYWVGGVERGREAIYKNLASFGTGRQSLDKAATTRPRFIHTFGSQRIDFTGPDTAHDVGMWLGFNNQAEDGSFRVAEFGHYEDKYVKIEGRWYISERRIYNERLGNKALYYPELGEKDPRQK
ncbi:nuclear transport factor 2 family protein [Croceibacterium aestuarii]|uniref:nuclear transport factor 2 family protein n=1 Tax=Croceibacterium aestuarii TaxID=3064139 RepID=UPI00272EE0F5|nr:nuclear transport factor 2 family protein [Croceibacterium sp. D39]